MVQIIKAHKFKKGGRQSPFEAQNVPRVRCIVKIRQFIIWFHKRAPKTQAKMRTRDIWDEV